MTELPRTVKTLVKRLTPGWTHRIVLGNGTMAVSYYGEPRGDGTRPLLHRRHPCTSLALRLRCLDGRAAVGVWVRPDGEPFGFDSAFLWTTCQDPQCRYVSVDHPAEVPTLAKSGRLAEWLATPSSDLDISTHGLTDVRSAA